MTTSQQTQLKFDTSRIAAQRAFMMDKSPELLYSGAFGAGKSRVGCEKGLLLSETWPNNRGLVCRKKYTDLRDTTMETWRRYVMPESHLKAYNKQEHKMTLVNGSEILWYGLDQFTKVGSLEVGWIFCDELIEFTEDDWTMLLGRLRHPMTPFHQIFAATNPADPSHWVYRRFYLNQELRREGTVKVFNTDALSNTFNPADYLKRLSGFKGKYRERYVEGKWIGFEGLVYDIWDPTKNVLSRDTKEIYVDGHEYKLTGDSKSPIPHDWEKYRVIDFGFTNPFVCQWWASPKYRYEGEVGKQDRVAIPPNERIWVMYNEIYMSGVTTPEHAREIHRISGKEEYRTTFADWDAGDRALLSSAGIPTSKAYKDVSPGIQSVYDSISEGRVFILENSLIREDPELISNSKPASTLEEFPLYMRAKSKAGRNPDENPIKAHDHGMDAMRYMIGTFNKLNKVGNAFKGKTKAEIDQSSPILPPSNLSRFPVERIGFGVVSIRKYG